MHTIGWLTAVSMMTAMFAALGCGPAVVEPARFRPPVVPHLEASPPSPVAVPRFERGDVRSLIATPVSEEAAGPRPLPDLSGRGLGLALATDGAQPGDAWASALTRVFALRLLRAGYTRALDVRALRPVTATLQEKGRTLAGTLDRMLVLERFPRVDFVLYGHELAAESVSVELAPPVPKAEAELARYREAFAGHQQAIERAVQPIEAAAARFRMQCRAAVQAFDAEAAKAKDPALREENGKRREQAQAYCSDGVTRLAGLGRALAAKYPTPEQLESEVKRLRAPVQVAAHTVRLAITLFDTHTGETIFAASLSRRDVGPAEALEAIVDHLARRLLANTRLPAPAAPIARDVAAPAVQPDGGGR
jgi:hypothetical protein